MRIVYNIPSIDSTTFSTPSPGLERFNVYGTVRSLTNNFDKWYPDGKMKVKEYYQSQLGSSTTTSSKLISPSELHSKFTVATNPISFHYVSELESSLLYSLLSSRTIQNSGSGPGTTHTKALNASYIMKVWPKTNQELGHYSLKIGSQSEATLIANYISRVQLAL